MRRGSQGGALSHRGRRIGMRGESDKQHDTHIRGVTGLSQTG